MRNSTDARSLNAVQTVVMSFEQFSDSDSWHTRLVMHRSDRMVNRLARQFIISFQYTIEEPDEQQPNTSRDAGQSPEEEGSDDTADFDERSWIEELAEALRELARKNKPDDPQSTLRSSSLANFPPSPSSLLVEAAEIPSRPPPTILAARPLLTDRGDNVMLALFESPDCSLL
ncbi:MAG: hypothetical protein M9890_13855 [Thermomicrobiales bacterium]|nr:hypothetical protein [Thermomicrobiales bacterium]